MNPFKTASTTQRPISFPPPGRTELGGNHTDHQHGCVLAAAEAWNSKTGDNITADDVKDGILYVYVTTTPGTAPQMPATVSVTADGQIYGLPVRWEQIPEAWYAAEGSFTVLGYVAQLDTYTEATVLSGRYIRSYSAHRHADTGQQCGRHRLWCVL